MELIIQTLKSLSLVIVDPTLALILVVLALVFYLRNRKISIMQKMIAGESINSPLELTASQICFGLIGGILGSIILTTLGVVFSKTSGIQFIFIVSLLLMVVKPRFICFSYSGAVLGFLSLIVTYLYPEKGWLNIDIVSLMVLVGVLHIIEGLLVTFDGSRGSIPVFTKKDGKILGGYAMRRYWVLPIAIFIALENIDSSSNLIAGVNTPSFWPLISNSTVLLGGAALMSIPFMGMLSYSTVTFTRSRKEKVRSSGIMISLYGVCLSLISGLANFGLAGKIIVLILAPLLHELMLNYSKRLEEKREPIFYSEEGRIKVLEVVPDTIAYEAGIKVGDDIIKVNDTYINSEKDVYVLSRREVGSSKLLIRRKDKTFDVELKFKKDKRLGLVLVPILVKDEAKIDVESKSFKDLLCKIKEKQIELNEEAKKKNIENEESVSDEEKRKEIDKVIDEIKDIEVIEEKKLKK